MGKHPGILEKLKNKKQPPVPTRRIAVPDYDANNTQGTTESRPAADDFTYLEDKPEAAAASFGDSESVVYRAKEPKSRSKSIVDSMNMSRRHRSNKPSLWSKLRVLTDTILGKRTRESAALDFAMNHKRVTKKQRRRRMLLAYVGTGIAVAAVLLVVVFVPGGKAASTADANPNSAMQIAAAQDLTTKDSPVAAPTQQESPTVSVSEEPVVSESGILEPQGEDTSVPVEGLEPTEEPTMEPTIEPTEEPSPIATTAPDPTPPAVKLEDCVKDFVVEADKYYNDMGYSSNHYNYSEDDVYMLAQVITSEARGESRTGMIAVGNVIMNRVLNRYKFANNIKDVISAPGQFAYNPNVKPTGAAKTAARYVLQYEVWVVAQDVYYFRSGAPSGTDWGSHKFYTKIGGHCFYSQSYGGRHRGGEAPPKLFERTYKYAQYGCKPEKRVYRIQWMLNKLDYDVKADSYFGQDSVDALKAFQEKYGMEADGIAGPATVSKLIDVYGLSNYYQKFLAKAE